jgi:DNA-binding response OmpR family regulator
MEPTDELILLIERAGKPEETFAPILEQKGFRLSVAPTGQQAVKLAHASLPALVVLNAASLGSNGLRVCHWLREELRGTPIIHILLSEDGDKAKVSVAEVALVMPFTPRKLINRILRLLPGQRKDALVVGPIRFSPGVRIVEAYGKERRLTPKTATLLEIFLKNPGETLDRGTLMREVWDTTYIGDTRTLDVHVRWVREAVEPDPASPQHIVTVRRVGYRFVPNPTSARQQDGKK